MLEKASTQRQLQLRGFPRVGNPQGLSEITPWVLLGYKIGECQIPTRILQQGSNAFEVVHALMKAYPIRAVRLASINTELWSKAPRNITRVRSVDITRDLLQQQAIHRRGVSGWNSIATGLGIRSSVELIGGGAAYIPIMKVTVSDPERIAHQFSEGRFPGWVLEEGISLSKQPEYVFCGSQLLGRDHLADFHNFSRENVSGVAEQDVNAMYAHRGTLRLFAEPPFRPIEPTVVAVAQ